MSLDLVYFIQCRHTCTYPDYLSHSHDPTWVLDYFRSSHVLFFYLSFIFRENYDTFSV